jgi:DNA-binding ferritin-like protein
VDVSSRCHSFRSSKPCCDYSGTLGYVEDAHNAGADKAEEGAERARKIGGTTLRSIGQIAKLQGIDDNDESYLAPGDMPRELIADNKRWSKRCANVMSGARAQDVATANLLEILSIGRSGGSGSYTICCWFF